MRLGAKCAGAIAIVALTGCGSAKHVCYSRGIKCENLPKHKVLHVDWKESANADGKPIATFRVSTIEIGPRGWTLRASFVNTSPRTLKIAVGGPNQPRDFGLGVFVTPLPQRIEDSGNYLLKAQRVTPRLPRVLRPGQSWSGTLTSSEPPRNRRWLRVLFGVFFWKGKPPYGLGPFFLWQTSHVVRAPGPVGPGGPKP